MTSVLPAGVPNGIVYAAGENSGPLPARRNVSRTRSREVYAVLRPRTVDEVRATVRAFGAAPVGPRLHAISTGRNWGLGSREPAGDGVVTMELAGLDAVRELDVDGGWAVVEPGVTQLRLAGMLEGTPRMLNVTASSGHTSVLGNTVDRGVGLRRQRIHDLAGLEVVLPDGELVRVGWWPREGRPGAVNPLGVGPSLLHLFTQSDLGIVTAAVVRLLPRPDVHRIVHMEFGADRAAEAVDMLRRWVVNGLTSGVVKVYDTTSTRSYGGTPGHFGVHLCVDGTADSVAALTGVVVGEASGSGVFGRIGHSDEAAPDPSDTVAEVVRRGHAGDPGANEAMLRAAVGQDAGRVDSHGGGWRFFLPFVPFTGPALARAYAILDEVEQRTGVRAGSTVNALEADVVDLVVSFRFPPTDEETARAGEALDLTYELFAAEGYLPYRLDVDRQGWAEEIAPDPASADLARQIKKYLDPRSVIAAGRYS